MTALNNSLCGSSGALDGGSEANDANEELIDSSYVSCL